MDESINNINGVNGRVSQIGPTWLDRVLLGQQESAGHQTAIARRKFIKINNFQILETFYQSSLMRRILLKCGNMIETRQSDIIVLHKNEKSA